MLIKKVLNNSLILAENDGEEIILMGKGIGFHGKVGDDINLDDVEKVFSVKQPDALQKYEEYAQNIPGEYFELASHIADEAAERLGGKLNDSLILLLADHIAYAVERQSKGIAVQNRLLWEIKSFYPNAFAVGEWAIQYIREQREVALPEDEAGNIAFHLVNAQSEARDMKDAIAAVSMMKDMLGIIQIQCPHGFEHNGLHYSRMITHIQFFLQRIMSGNMLKNDDVFILAQYARRYPKEADCVEKIAAYIKGKLGLSISLDEKLYLLLHIVRNVNQNLDCESEEDTDA